MVSISLNAKNPFMSATTDIGKLSTWWGIFLFAVLGAGFMVFYRMVSPKTSQVVGKTSGMIGRYLGQVIG